MKPLLLFLFLSLSLAGFGQDFQIGGFDNDCGTWVKDTVTVSDWQTVDTTNYDPCASAEWVYTNWITPVSNWTILVYCPCGCGYPDIRERYRVNLQGIRQKQTERTTYRYVPKLKTEYEKVWDEIYKRTKADTLPIASFGTTLTDSLSDLLYLHDSIANLYIGSGLSYNDPDTSKVIFFCKEPGQKAGFVTYQPGYLIYHPLGGKKEYFDRYWGRIKKTVLFTVEDEEK
jgi:hypothetical protein